MKKIAKWFARTAVAAFLCACATACASGPVHPEGWAMAAPNVWTSGAQRYEIKTQPFSGDLKTLGGQAVVDTIMASKAKLAEGQAYPACPGLGIILTFHLKRGTTPQILEEVMSIRESQATTISYTREASTPQDPAATKAITTTTCRSIT